MPASHGIPRPLVVVLALGLSGLTQAAQFNINMDGTFERTWNPRAPQGLTAVMSGDFDYIHSYSLSSGGPEPKIYHHFEHTVVRGAVYGSDTSSGDGLLNPRLKGYAIEPMADSALYYQGDCSSDGDPADCVGGWFGLSSTALASVGHRVVQRGGIAPELKGVLDGLRSVPVYLDYSLSAQITAINDPPYFFSGASASFSVTQDIDPLFGREACAGLRCTGAGAVAGRWSTTLKPSTEDINTVYTIGVIAETYMRLGQRAGTYEGQAVADPFFSIDPTWQYAPYFEIQQESTLHPGEWVEVTRAWRDTPPIPEPGTAPLALVGVVLIGAWKRVARYRRTSRIER